MSRRAMFGRLRWGGWFTDALETGAYRIGHGPKVQRFSKGRVSERGD
jgi:hypothetical protein